MTAVLRDALTRVAESMGAPPEVAFTLERPREANHGDLATNLALILAKQRKANPRALAATIVEALDLSAVSVSKVDIAGPGFINFWLSLDHLDHSLNAILKAGDGYGRSNDGAGLRANVEFVSANPTGPLHVGHGRGAVLGDALASLLEATGFKVTREFYVNDAGVQIDRLAESVWARVQEVAGRASSVPEGGYHGLYLRDLADALLAEQGAAFADLPEADGLARCREAALTSQRLEQDSLLRDLGVCFEVVASEQALYDHGKVDESLRALDEAGLTFEDQGALWLRTGAFGDDKDRVLRKSDGSLTYLAPDIAYHMGKHKRGFDLAIDVWGADHHGYIPRMRAVLRALGYPDAFFEVVLVQLVKIVRAGEEVRMSKRSGEFITLRDLIEEVGRDAARYFFLMRRSEAQFVFDVDLATRQTDENPIYYVQMAHARMSGIFRTAERDPETVTTGDASALPRPEDQDLLKWLTRFPEVVSRAARHREPHLVTGFLEELARQCHGWYHNCRVLGEEPVVESARLALARATRIVLANGLRLLGLHAPDRM